MIPVPEVEVTSEHDQMRFRWDRFASQVKNALHSEVCPHIAGEMAEYVSYWDHQPLFVWDIHGGGYGSNIVASIYPFGAYAHLWEWVSRGTPGRWIPKGRPKKRKTRLKIRKYKPHTGKTFHNGPGAYYGEPVFPFRVKWPGIAARHFEEDLISRRGAYIVSLLQTLVHEAIEVGFYVKKKRVR